uniref:Uncharacterized protein n=1 Tax=Romanomermis culicivorax TaxID=13658 RepID=A0A915L0Q9_ROMCU
MHIGDKVVVTLIDLYWIGQHPIQIYTADHRGSAPATSTQDIQCQQLYALLTSSHHTAEQTTIKEGLIC